MKPRELINQVTVMENATAFAGATRGWTTDPPQIYLGITDAKYGKIGCQYSLDLSREDAQQLIDQLTAALALPAHTAEEVANHQAHVAFRKERDRGY